MPKSGRRPQHQTRRFGDVRNMSGLPPSSRHFRTRSALRICANSGSGGALEPVDRAEEVPLSDRHATMTQDVVRRSYKEEEIRQGELLQIIVALHLSVVAAGAPGDDLALCTVDLCASQGLHEA